MPSGFYDRSKSKKPTWKHKKSTLERFLVYVYKQGPLWNGTCCWLWRGYIYKNGYGTFTDNKVRKMAHRYSYELFVGPIGEGLEVDHLCRNRACVNPQHLEAVTTVENNNRRPKEVRINHNTIKRQCKNGHEFTEENTYRMPDGGRSCRTCGREHMRVWRSSKKGPEDP